MTNMSKKSVRYDEGCLGAHALNQIGDRWALLVVRELMFQPRRFQMLRTGLPGITASILTQRLQQLVESGIVTHDPDYGTYALTDVGHQLMPVLQALCRWALIMPGHDPTRFISPAALMISLTTTRDAQALSKIGATAAVLSGRDGFVLRPTAQGELAVTANRDPVADFTLSGDGNALAAVFYGPLKVTACGEYGAELHGDPVAAQDFIDCFSLQPQI